MWSHNSQFGKRKITVWFTITAFKFDVGVNVQSWLIFEILTRSINDARGPRKIAENVQANKNKNKRGRWASGRRHREFDFRCRCKGKDARRNDISWVRKKIFFTGDSFIQRKTSQYKQSWSAGLQTVPRAGGYFYSVPNNDLLSFSYDGRHFAFFTGNQRGRQDKTRKTSTDSFSCIFARLALIWSTICSLTSLLFTCSSTSSSHSCWL